MSFDLPVDRDGYVRPFKFLNSNLLADKKKFLRRIQRSRSLVVPANVATAEVELFDPKTLLRVDGSTFLVKAIDENGPLTISYTVKVLNKIELHFTRMTVGETVVYAKWSEVQL